MKEDRIMEEVKTRREKIAKECNYEMKQITTFLKKRAQEVRVSQKQALQDSSTPVPKRTA